MATMTRKEKTLARIDAAGLELVVDRFGGVSISVQAACRAGEAGKHPLVDTLHQSEAKAIEAFLAWERAAGAAKSAGRPKKDTVLVRLRLPRRLAERLGLIGEGAYGARSERLTALLESLKADDLDL